MNLLISKNNKHERIQGQRRAWAWAVGEQLRAAAAPEEGEEREEKEEEGIGGGGRKEEEDFGGGGKEEEEEGGGGQKGRPQEGRRAGKSSAPDCDFGEGHVPGRARPAG